MIAEIIALLPRPRKNWGQSSYHVMAASRGSANRPPSNSWAPVVELADSPVGPGGRFIALGEILGGRYALPRDAAMTKQV